MDNLEEQYIIEICRRIPGIGNVTAAHIASDFDSSVENFLAATETRLLAIKKSNQRLLLTNDHAKQLLATISEIPKGRSINDLWLILIFKDFLQIQIRALSNLSMNNLDLNPFLAKALDFKNRREILEFNLYQAITRSIVTSWGMTIDKVFTKIGAHIYDGNHPGIRRGNKPDIQLQKGNKKNYIQLKSGPNTMNIGMVESLNMVIDEIERIEPGNKVLLGMTYGTRSKVSSQIQGTLTDFENNSLIGRELWDFVTGIKDYHKKLFFLLDEASKGIMDKSFIDLIGDKIDAMEKEWESNYGNTSLDEVLENYV